MRLALKGSQSGPCLAVWFYALAAAGGPALAGAVELPLVAATSSRDGLPFRLFHGETWRPEPGTAYAKLHLHFEQGFKIHGVRITGCAGYKWKEFVSAYINFDEEPLEFEPTKESGAPLLWFDKDVDFDVRSFTVNFNNNLDPCVAGLSFLDAQKKEIPVSVPAVVSGEAQATSTLAPEDSYGVANLFDSRFEYAWASSGAPRGVSLNFAFKEPSRITRLKVWNGYQRSDRHCWSNARAKSVKVTGDGGYSATLTLLDRMGPQVVTLPKPFNGRNLRLEVAEEFPGRQYKDLVISELRFGNDAGWFLPDMTAAFKGRESRYRDAFRSAGLERALDTALVNEVGYPDGKCANALYQIRLRSDGTVYLETHVCEAKRKAGQPEDAPTMGRRRYALGNFEVKKVDAGKGAIDLRVFGLLGEAEISMDCNGCGRDCNGGKDGGGGRIFEDMIRIVRDGGPGPLPGKKYWVENVAKVPRFRFMRQLLNESAQ